MITTRQPDASTVPQAERYAPTQLVGLADFETMYQQFERPLTHFIVRLVHNDEQARDLTQDVFVKAYRSFLGGTVIPSKALKTWLYRIASNTAVDALRRGRLIAWVPLSAFNEDHGFRSASTTEEKRPDERFTSAHSGNSLHPRGSYSYGFEDRLADREIIEHIFQQLPPQYAICLWLYENNGLSCSEIANMLHISESAVKMRLVRARKRCIAIVQQSHRA